MCGSAVTPNVMLAFGERVIERHEQIVHRTFEALDERRGDRCGTGGDADRRRLDVAEAILDGFAHADVPSSSAARSPFHRDLPPAP